MKTSKRIEKVTENLEENGYSISYPKCEQARAYLGRFDSSSLVAYLKRQGFRITDSSEDQQNQTLIAERIRRRFGIFYQDYGRIEVQKRGDVAMVSAYGNIESIVPVILKTGSIALKN